MMIAASRVSHPHSLEILVKAARINEAEVVMLCGDVNISESFLNALSNSRVVMISGDDDDVHIIKVARKYNALIDGKIVEISGMKIGGVGAVSTSLNSTSLILAGGNVDILMTHYPPYGCLDRIPPLFIPSGLKTIRNVVDTLKPSLVLIGHAAKPAVSFCGNAIAINISRTITIIDSLKPRRVRFIPLAESTIR